MKKAVFRQRYNDVTELDIVIFCAAVYTIGGIEAWIYYVAKKYNIGQISLLYCSIDEKQKRRLEPHVKLVQYTGQPLRCNKIIFTEPRDFDQRLYDSAKERYITLHCNYKDNEYDYRKIPQMDKIYAVSDMAKECYESIQEQKVFTLYSPVEIDEPRRMLKLISATRWRIEKGSERMKELAAKLDESGIPYMWLIFTDHAPEKVHENIIFMRPRYNMSDYIVQADYGVQLSDDESYCLFIQECLKLNVPVIVTDLPVYKEAGITRKEGYKLKLDMSNLDVEKIYNKIPKVNYKGKDSDKEYRKLLEVRNEKESIQRKTIKSNRRNDTQPC